MRTGLKLALLLPLFALMAPTGGFPSRPTFQKVTVNAPASTIGLTVNALAGGQAAQLSAPSGANGLLVNAGATSSDVVVRFFNGPATANYQEIFGDGHGFLGPTGNLNWTAAGAYTIAAPSAGAVSLTIAPALPGQFGESISGNATTGNSFGLNILAGTNASDIGLQVNNAANSLNYFRVLGDGSLVTSTATAKGIGTINTPSGLAATVLTAVLASDSVKTSNTTQALDATLQLTIPAAGTYMIELNGAIVPAGIAAGAGGFAGCLQYSGTVPVLSAATYSAALFVTNVAFSNQWLVEQQMVTTCTGGSQVVYSSQTVGGTFDQLAWRGVLTTSTGGTFGLSWAQSSSSATATTLKQGMVLSATRIL